MDRIKDISVLGQGQSCDIGSCFFTRSMLNDSLLSGVQGTVKLFFFAFREVIVLPYTSTIPD